MSVTRLSNGGVILFSVGTSENDESVWTIDSVKVNQWTIGRLRL